MQWKLLLSVANWRFSRETVHFPETRKPLRHPNLCVANLLGEVCPIVQKFRDFSPFLGGRLKPLRLHESWREGTNALKMNAAGAVHCLWRFNAACFDTLGGQVQRVHLAPQNKKQNGQTESG